LEYSNTCASLSSKRGLLFAQSVLISVTTRAAFSQIISNAGTAASYVPRALRIHLLGATAEDLPPRLPIAAKVNDAHAAHDGSVGDDPPSLSYPPGALDGMSRGQPLAIPHGGIPHVFDYGSNSQIQPLLQGLDCDGTRAGHLCKHSVYFSEPYMWLTAPDVLSGAPIKADRHLPVTAVL
jgi:hypothetical protein